MAPKKKPRNAFFLFMIDYKEEQERKYKRSLDMAEAQTEAGKIWADMNNQQRGPYVERAKDDKVRARVGNEKYTSSGIPLSRIEKEEKAKDTQERLMKKEIEDAVKSSFADDTYAEQKYYFIHVNYFSKTIEGNVYVPCELALSCYSLKDGINNTFHTYINPGSGIFGHAYEAKNHAETTHQLPLPPNALGEMKLSRIYHEILEFIRPSNGSKNLPPVYTHSHLIRVVQSSLDFIRSADDYEETQLKVYPIHYLFYEMGAKAADKSGSQKPENYYVMEALFDRDVYEHRSGIACDYHDKVDASKFCSLSAVIRWGYQFSDCFCLELAIPVIPGRHVPSDSDLQVVKLNDTKTFYTETDSIVSDRTFASTSFRTDITQPKIERQELETTSYSGLSQNDFPALGVRKKRSEDGSVLNSSVASEDGDEEESKVENPWAVRSKFKPRPPSEDSFNFASVVSGRGRGIAIKSDASTTGSVRSFGRGRYFHQE